MIPTTSTGYFPQTPVKSPSNSNLNNCQEIHFEEAKRKMGKESNSTQAIYILLELADSGFTSAQKELNSRHNSDNRKQLQELVDCCQQLLSQQDSPSALYTLGCMLYDGSFFMMDKTTAIDYWEKSADLNYIPAMKVLAHLYLDGIDVKQDLAKAQRYFITLNESGCPIEPWCLELHPNQFHSLTPLLNTDLAEYISPLKRQILAALLIFIVFVNLN